MSEEPLTIRRRGRKAAFFLLAAALAVLAGAGYALRGAFVMDRCRSEEPPAKLVGPGHTSWCLLERSAGERSAPGSP
ncbi:MAG: hypothetical protein HY721_27940 [Planctomycetes bacterium]|nr:hypothetical protein [Planctomycetota bacterium]